MLTKVNIQQIVPNDQLSSSMSTYYAFAAQKNHIPFLEQRKVELPTAESPSSSLRESNPSESFGVLLPNVQKAQYKRYERYKK